MGKLIEFPLPLIVRETDPRLGGFGGSEDDHQPDPEFRFQERPMAKSSTSVMQAGVCQGCGCKRVDSHEAQVNAIKAGCICPCHKGERS